MFDGKQPAMFLHSSQWDSHSDLLGNAEHRLQRHNDDMYNGKFLLGLEVKVYWVFKAGFNDFEGR